MSSFLYGRAGKHQKHARNPFGLRCLAWCRCVALARKGDSSNYRSMVASRRTLPAFKSRTDVIGAWRGVLCRVLDMHARSFHCFRLSTLHCEVQHVTCDSYRDGLIPTGMVSRLRLSQYVFDANVSFNRVGVFVRICSIDSALIMLQHFQFCLYRSLMRLLIYDSR